MTLKCYHTPFLFHEAVELLFLYTNGLPMPDLSPQKSPYSVPAAELERIMLEASQNISWEDEVLQTFFRQYKLPKSADGAFTCLARVLAFSFADLSCQTAAQAVESIIQRLDAIRESELVFEGLRPFTINTHPGTEANAGIHTLCAPAAFRQALLDVYNNPRQMLQPLIPLMSPVMSCLQQELRPWAFRAEPMLQVWENTLRTQPPEQFFKESLHYSEVPPANHIEFGLTYFLPQWLIFGLDDDNTTENNDSTMKIFIGAGSVLLMDHPVKGLMGWEYRALHLLSSPVRMRMIEAIKEKPMSSRELAQALNLHLGTVARDINSMDEAYLLNRTIHRGPRRRYSLNKQALRTLAQHLLSICDDDSTQESEIPPSDG